MADETPPAPTPEPEPAKDAAAANGPPPARKPRAWKDQSPTATSSTEPKGKGLTIFGVLAAILAILGALLALFLWLSPVYAPVVQSVSITEYERGHVPVNALAQQDSALLIRHFPATASRAFSSQLLDALRRELRNLAGASKGADALVVHLNALAQTDDNQVYLLPADFDPEQPDSTRLPLAEVLKALRDCGQVKSKVLLLDVCRPSADARLGSLLDDVAEVARAQLEPAVLEDDKLVVLLPCSPGQVSLASEDLGHSVFAYYLDEGLRGHADRYGPTWVKGDRRVTAQELASFVQARVDRWAELNRRTRQTPLLLGKAADFQLVALDVGAPPAPEVEAPPEAYPKELLQGWQRRDAWLDGDVPQLAPRELRKLEAQLLRAEQRLLGGATLDEVVKEYAGEADRFVREVEKARRAVRPPSALGSLARVPVQDPKAFEALVESLKNQLVKLEQLVKPVPADLEKARMELGAKLPAHADVARAVRDVIVDDTNLLPIKLHFLHQLVRAQQKNEPPFLETLLLQRLTDLPGLALGAAVPPRVGDTIRQAFRLQVASEWPTTLDPRVLEWVRKALEAADAEHYAEQLELFGDGLKTQASADALLQRLLATEKLYQQVNGNAERLQDAYRAYDRALTVLPGLAPYLTGRLLLDPEHETRWLTAVRYAVEVRGLLTVTGGPEALGDAEFGARLDDLRTKTSELTRLSEGDQLRQKFSGPALARLPDVAEMEAVLATTWPRAGERAELWKRRRARAAALRSQTAEADDADNLGEGKRTRAPDGFDSAAALEQERLRGERRARVTLGLLRLAGLNGVETLTAEYEGAKRLAKREALQALGGKLRQAWAEQLPRQMEQMLKGRDLAGADRASRLLHPFDRGRERGRATSQETNPTSQLQAEKARAFWGWLAARHRRLSLSPDAPQYYRDFHDRATSEYSHFSS